MSMNFMMPRRASCALVLFFYALASNAQGNDKIDPQLRGLIAKKSAQTLNVLILPKSIAKRRVDPTTLSDALAPSARPQAIYAALSREAAASQRGLRRWLARRDIDYRAFTVVDAIAAALTPAQIEQLAARNDVAQIDYDPRVKQVTARGVAKDACSPNSSLTWGLLKINADDVWALPGSPRGAGVVVAGQDTGYAWEHAALKPQYRGWNGASADHGYNWHDAIHNDNPNSGGANSCGFNALAPCDDDEHGTHTMGTMVGSNRVDRFVGVAPDAKWIGCRNMENGYGLASTYLECFDWFLAPTDLNGQNPDPLKAPHVINNSWGCALPAEGEDCDNTTLAAFDTAVNNLTAAGVLVVVSAGNSGSACSTINTPPAMSEAALVVGATSSSDAIASFSSRGPVTRDGSNRLKPDVAAPGVNVCSSVPSGGYAGSGWSGTSMAGPHVAGVAALIMSAVPSLRRDPVQVKEFILASAQPLTSTQSCGGYPGSASPNAVFGYGRIDALAAVNAAIAWAANSGVLFADGFD
jgi:subtilisin family serine protease